MKAKIATFSLKGKVGIWWVDVKSVKGIWEQVLIWEEIKRLFKKKYLPEMYDDIKVEEFYEMEMGSMIDDEYTRRFLELFTYVPYLKGEKANIRRFIS